MMEPSINQPKRGIGSIMHFFVSQTSAPDTNVSVRQPPDPQTIPAAIPAPRREEPGSEDTETVSISSAPQVPPVATIEEQLFSPAYRYNQSGPENILLGEIVLADHLADSAEKLHTYAMYLASLDEHVALVNINRREVQLCRNYKHLPLEYSCIAAAEQLEAGNISVLNDLTKKHDIVLINLEKSFRSQARDLIRNCTWVTVLCAADDSGMVETYKIIKWLAEDIGWRDKISLFVCGEDSEDRAENIYKKLADTTREFLDIEIELAGFAPAGECVHTPTVSPSDSIEPDDNRQPSDHPGELPVRNHAKMPQENATVSGIETNIPEPKIKTPEAEAKPPEAEVKAPANIFEERSATPATGTKTQEEPRDTTRIDGASRADNAAGEEINIPLKETDTPVETKVLPAGLPDTSRPKPNIPHVYAPIPINHPPRTDEELTDLLQLALPGGGMDRLVSPLVIPLQTRPPFAPVNRVMLDGNGRLYVLQATLRAEGDIFTAVLTSRKWLCDNMEQVLLQCRQLQVDRTLEPGIVIVAGGELDAIKTGLSQLGDFPCLLLQLNYLHKNSEWSLLLLPA